MSGRKKSIKVEISASPPEYHTTDITHAAALLERGITFLGVGVREEKVRGRKRERTVFRFERSSEVADILRDLMNGVLQVNARDFVHRQLDLKSLSHNRPTDTEL